MAHRLYDFFLRERVLFLVLTSFFLPSQLGWAQNCKTLFLCSVESRALTWIMSAYICVLLRCGYFFSSSALPFIMIINNMENGEMLFFFKSFHLSLILVSVIFSAVLSLALLMKLITEQLQMVTSPNNIYRQFVFPQL